MEQTRIAPESSRLTLQEERLFDQAAAIAAIQATLQHQDRRIMRIHEEHKENHKETKKHLEEIANLVKNIDQDLQRKNAVLRFLKWLAGTSLFLALFKFLGFKFVF